MNCEKRFPNISLVYQFYFDDSVTGYIAKTTSNIFRYNETSAEDKTIIVALRGTRSIFDTLTDLKVDMIPYSNTGTKLPLCGFDCKVHRGFHDYYMRTLSIIHPYIMEELNGCVEDDNYELIILGHSLGGSIAYLLGLHYLDLGFDKLTLVTMGQPLLGNENFVSWGDKVLGVLMKLNITNLKGNF